MCAFFFFFFFFFLFQLNSKEVELQEARLSSERTMVQMMELTNEVNTKQDEVRTVCAVLRHKIPEFYWVGS